MVRARRVLPDPGGPISSSPWPPASAISSPRRASTWPRTSPRSGVARPPATPPLARCRVVRHARDGIDELDPSRSGRDAAAPARTDALDRVREGVHADHLHPVDEPGLGDGRGGHDDPPEAAPGEHRDHRQDARHGAHLAAERQLADQRHAARSGADLLRAEQDADGHRQVERGTALAQVGRGEVDRDPARRMDESGIAQRPADALARLLERGVGEADDGEARASPGRHRPRPG